MKRDGVGLCFETCVRYSQIGSELSPRSGLTIVCS